MEVGPTQCPIWGRDFLVFVRCPTAQGLSKVESSARAGGDYEIIEQVRDLIQDLDDMQKARLTTILVDQRIQGIESPIVTSEMIAVAKRRRPLPVYERADRLLRYFVNHSPIIGQRLDIGIRSKTQGEALAWSDSVEEMELMSLCEYLGERGWLVSEGGSKVRVLVDGYNRIADHATNLESSQAFVAMWFHERTNLAYDLGIRPAIEEAGYVPMRIDRKPDLNKIDDEVIGEIRRSRFLIADFTHGEDGARGSVYFEAGFALGLNIPVVFCCRNGTKPHFDTQQYYHIFWDKPEELRRGLLQSILARIGEGPVPKDSEL